MTKRELDERLLFFNPAIVFDGTPGGIKLIMTVDAFNGHINWSVQEGDHYTDFKDFGEARDYYLKVAFGGVQQVINSTYIQIRNNSK